MKRLCRALVLMGVPAVLGLAGYYVGVAVANYPVRQVRSCIEASVCNVKVAVPGVDRPAAWVVVGLLLGLSLVWNAGAGGGVASRREARRLAYCAALKQGCYRRTW
ncbi:MAG: hypothetical protein ACLQNG_13270 [Acidimicrobiales bacterium]